MGIILDSSVIIAAERRGHTVREILEQLKAVQGEIGYEVATLNLRDFQRIPGLSVIQF